MYTEIKLQSVLSRKMQHEFEKYAELINALEKEGYNCSVSTAINQNIEIIVRIGKALTFCFRIITTPKGYKLTANYRDWRNNISVDFKVVERVYPETIVDNLNRIAEDPGHYLNEYFNQRNEWAIRRQELRKNQVLKNLMSQ